MKITDVQALAYSYPLSEPIGNGVRWNPARNAVVVLVSTDAGVEGVGEADCAGGPPETTVTIILKELRPRLIGKDPLDVERIWQASYHASMIHGRRGAVIAAMSGIDIALWDILGKVAGLPIFRLLGGARDTVRAYASGGFYKEGKGLADLADEAGSYVRAGYTAVKMKIGRLPLEEDLQRVAAVREAIGDAAMLMVDANSAYGVKTAVRMAGLLERYCVSWLEEPVSPDDMRGSARVAESTQIPIAGYETEYTRFGFRDLIACGAIDIAQPDVIRSGGFTECRKIAALASAHGLPCTAHMFSSGLSLVANLHFMAAIDNGFMMECDQNPNPLRTALLDDLPAIDGEGCLAPPTGPGLGVQLNLAAVERYRIG